MQSNRFLLFSIISRYPKCFKKIPMECIEFLENQLNYCKIGLIEIEKYIEKNKNDEFNNSQDEDYMKELENEINNCKDELILKLTLFKKDCLYVLKGAFQSIIYDYRGLSIEDIACMKEDLQNFKDKGKNDKKIQKKK